MRAMLRELGRGEYFTVSSVEAFLRKQLWSDHVNDLAKQGKISPDNAAPLQEDRRTDQLKP